MKKILLIAVLLLLGCSPYVRHSSYEWGYWPTSAGYFGQESIYGLFYYRPPPVAFNRDDVANMVDRFISATGNPNLQVGNIRELERGFEIDVLTRTGALVDTLYADKYTSWIGSVYDSRKF